MKLEKMNENNMECVNKVNKKLIDTPSTVKTQPLYDTAVINVQNNAQSSSNIFFLTFFMCTSPSPSELNKETRPHGPAHAAVLAWFHELFLNQQQREIETICKTLPYANNSKTFVDVLRLHTRCTIKRLGLQIDLFMSFGR